MHILDTSVILVWTCFALNAGALDYRRFQINSSVVPESKRHVVPVPNLFVNELYSKEINVLDAGNFSDNVYTRENAWVVEFYMYWCPHCVAFAPHFKTLAEDLAAWQSVVKLAVVHCALNENVHLCAQQNASRWPTIKYYSPHLHANQVGVDIKKVLDVPEMRRKIIARLEEDKNDHGDSTWPLLNPYNESNSKAIWNNVADSVVYQLLFSEAENDTYLGSEVILDLSNHPNILIRRLAINNLLEDEYNVTESPGIVGIDRNFSVENLDISGLNRTEIVRVIKSHLREKNLIDDVEDELDILVSTTEASVPRIVVPLANVKDYLYRADLESAVEYSLETEVTYVENITGDRMKALKGFVDVLASYFPLKTHNTEYLRRIQSSIKNLDWVSSEEFQKILKSAKQNSDFFSQSEQWVGCRGSNPRYRGYPCSLWTLFHTLTVNYAQAGTDDPTRVLKTMYNYIKNFFGCTGCAEHFVQMVADHGFSHVKSRDEAVMWLWESHNRVSKRVAGDATEDPAFPKSQYPKKQHCPQCWKSDGTWNKLEVLKYLKKKYSHSEVRNAN